MPISQGDLFGLPVKWRVLIGSYLSYFWDSFDLLALSMALPFIIQEFNLSMPVAGMLATGTLLGVGLSSVIMGWFSDTYGRRNAMMAGVFIFGLCTTLIGFSTGYYDVLLLRFFSGLGLGGIWTIVATSINETWPRSQQGMAGSLVMTSGTIGFAAAGLAAGYVIPTYGWRALFLLSVFAVIALLYLYFFMPESEVWKEQKKAATASQKVFISEIFAAEYLRRTVFGVLMTSFAMAGAWGINIWVPTFLVTERGMPFNEVSTFMAIFFCVNFFGFLIFGYLADKIGGKKALIVSFIGISISILWFVLAENINQLFWIGPLIGAFQTYPGICASYFAQLYPARIRSLGVGTCFNIGRTVSAFAPVILGQIACQYNLAVGLEVCGACFVLAMIMTLFLPEANEANKA